MIKRDRRALPPSRIWVRLGDQWRGRALVAGIALGFLLAGAPSTAIAGQTYFFANPGAPVDTPYNHLVVRPTGFPLFQDGQWVLEKLRWTDWGSSVAHAKGLSSSSDGQPNAAEGKRIVTWAKVRLSKPGRFRGHDVYRCFSITVPPPAHYGRSCLQRIGSVVGFFTPGSGKPVGEDSDTPGVRHLDQFFSPDRKVWCGFYDALGEVSCGTEPTPPTRSAFIDKQGRVSLCEVLQIEYPPGAKIPLGCYQNWPRPTDHLPVLHYGEEAASGHFRCTSATDGITCEKVSGAGKGGGFRVSKDEAVQT